MSKTFTAMWLGDGDPNSQIITEGGVRFIKGEPTQVPLDCTVNGVSWAESIRSNPTFAVEEYGEDEDPVDAGDAAERDAVKAELDAKGIKYAANAKLETLREKLAG